MRRETDGLDALAELKPTEAEIRALVDGSLEADGEIAPEFPLLNELPRPTHRQIAELKSRVIEALDAPPRTAAASAWVPWVLAALLLGLAAGVILL